MRLWRLMVDSIRSDFLDYNSDYQPTAGDYVGCWCFVGLGTALYLVGVGLIALVGFKLVGWWGASLPLWFYMIGGYVWRLASAKVEESQRITR